MKVQVTVFKTQEEAAAVTTTASTTTTPHTPPVDTYVSLVPQVVGQPPGGPAPQLGGAASIGSFTVAPFGMQHYSTLRLQQ